MMFWYGHDMGGWGYAAMAIGMFLFWALVVASLIALVRGVGGGQRTGCPGPAEADARQVLAMRYAQGDITETEYRERLAVLREHART
ncbi:hypothetical protein EB75_26490 [Mycobacterium sp. ST-F2]|uniref:SHOCT domain-containing protein n=1 Tax=Mycobacterium sp. ST-F2 TaxID=1490484 RepID=UPI0009394148|nr:SHOCT domain-containing protein [Mycobacterium sp. ST-F2]OKH85249.1 hypothetical protein EB75_26490 [Mycobacterium sp. ST-F2]